MSDVQSGQTGTMRALNAAHDKLIFGRRIRVLSSHLAATLPTEAHTVLDVGCGDGQVAVEIMKLRPEIEMTGVDVMIRPQTHIPVTQYDGDKLPFADNSFDCVTIVDVLHHTENPENVLKECARVARQAVVIKDHLREGLLAGPVLRAMDWVGNRGHNVVLPYNYLNQSEWQQAFDYAGLSVNAWVEKLELYEGWASWLCDRRLHFVAQTIPK